MPAGKEGGDPRASMPAAVAADVRPVVALPRGGAPAWMLVVAAILAGLLLFSILERRRAATAPSAVPGAGERIATPAPPPTLVIPPAPPAAETLPRTSPAPVPAPAPPAPAPPSVVYVPQPYAQPPPEEPPPPPRVLAEPALVFDTGGHGGERGAEGGGPPAALADGAAETAPPAIQGSTGTAVAGTRTRAGMLAHRSTTVPQGTLIPAVLETALDSTRPGLARAIVSRDVRGFDGSRVLVPRGSRLIGEYRSDVQPGQRRALVNWIRLIRPDGATIAIASPAGDPLGRGGIRARVNSHFLARFAGAILQSVLDIGVNVAAAQAGNGALVVLPGTVSEGARQVVRPQQVTPTLTVRHGTSISIFVARDLDFTGVEGDR